MDTFVDATKVFCWNECFIFITINYICLALAVLRIVSSQLKIFVEVLRTTIFWRLTKFFIDKYKHEYIFTYNKINTY